MYAAAGSETEVLAIRGALEEAGIVSPAVSRAGTGVGVRIGQGQEG